MIIDVWSDVVCAIAVGEGLCLFSHTDLLAITNQVGIDHALEGTGMITEIAQVEIFADKHEDFEKALSVAVETVLTKSKGFLDFELLHGIEQENFYTFLIRWETLEEHTVGFRESDLYVQWRAIIQPYFASSPQVDHWTPVFEFEK